MCTMCYHFHCVHVAQNTIPNRRVESFAIRYRLMFKSYCRLLSIRLYFPFRFSFLPLKSLFKWRSSGELLITLLNGFIQFEHVLYFTALCPSIFSQHIAPKSRCSGYMQNPSIRGQRQNSEVRTNASQCWMSNANRAWKDARTKGSIDGTSGLELCESCEVMQKGEEDVCLSLVTLDNKAIVVKLRINKWGRVNMSH